MKMGQNQTRTKSNWDKISLRQNINPIKIRTK